MSAGPPLDATRCVDPGALPPGSIAADACRIVVFAKAPVPGYAKTRLVPALGAAGAARLAERMLVEATTQAVAAAIGRVEVCCAPHPDHPAFVRLAARLDAVWSAQAEGDLGTRMAAAFARVLRTAPSAIVIGTDVPMLDAAYLRAAAAALLRFDAVLGPALDGGYTLLGLRRPAPALFDGIAWSTPAVLQQTRDRLHAAGLSHCELPALADIDEVDDLRHLPAGWHGVDETAPPGRD